MGKLQALTMTAAASDRIRSLTSDGSSGIRLSVNKKGCSGLSYVIEKVADAKKGDELIQRDGANLFVDPGALLFLWGTEVDYRDDGMQSSFSFSNPNEAGRCGCGESFHIACPTSAAQGAAA